MSVERPTFSEHWQRVATLRPRLRATVSATRQWHRGERWIVLQDEAANQFFRVNESGYFFIGLLDGRRTVAETWRMAQDALGDSAPTQGEAIQLLAQMWMGNLLQADLPPDAEALFRRRKQRVRQETLGHLQNFLFVRIPLFDPDAFLTRWLPVVGWMFSPIGLALWLIALVVGAAHLLGRWGAFFGEAQGALNVENLPLLYASLAGIKLVHEFAHGFACKRFGARAGSGGEAHTMGIMFLIFIPVPFIDATSSWALRSRRERIIVAGAGVFAELFLAAIAAIIWARTAPGTAHALAHNAMLIASVSTVLFNGNPLLRYDGYYALADLLDIPNLAQRSRDYLRYVFRRWVFGARSAHNPAHTTGERVWFTAYGMASLAYRIFIYAAIALFVAGKFWALGAILALGALVAWVVLPCARFVRYLAADPELARVRARAALASLAMIAAIVMPLALISAPEHARAEGVAEPLRMALIRAGVDGFLREALPSGASAPAGARLARSENPALLTQRAQLEARRRQFEARRRIALTRDVAEAQIIAEQIRALNDQIARLKRDIAALDVRSPLAGVWISPEIERSQGLHLARGERLGVVADPASVVVRAVVSQSAARVLTRSLARVEVRPRGRPQMLLHGERGEPAPAGSRRLPSAALGYAAGGAVMTDPSDPRGATPIEPVFEVLVALDAPEALLPGQRVVVRFTMPDRPLLLQWLDDLRRLLLRRLSL